MEETIVCIFCGNTVLESKKYEENFCSQNCFYEWESMYYYEDSSEYYKDEYE